jgi:N-alpha-acetyltransferase 50
LRYVVHNLRHNLTLSIPQPYRSRGLGSQSIQHIIKSAASQVKPKISTIYLHVQVSNQAGKTFYERHGFKEISVYKGYYKKIVPHDAWVLELEVAQAIDGAVADM